MPEAEQAPLPSRGTQKWWSAGGQPAPEVNA